MAWPPTMKSGPISWQWTPPSTPEAQALVWGPARPGLARGGLVAPAPTGEGLVSPTFLRRLQQGTGGLGRKTRWPPQATPREQHGRPTCKVERRGWGDPALQVGLPLSPPIRGCSAAWVHHSGVALFFLPLLVLWLWVPSEQRFSLHQSEKAPSFNPPIGVLGSRPAPPIEPSACPGQGSTHHREPAPPKGRGHRCSPPMTFDLYPLVSPH